MHVQALAARVLHGRDDLAPFLVAEEALLAGVGVEPAHGDPRPGLAEPVHGALGQPDHPEHAVPGA